MKKLLVILLFSFVLVGISEEKGTQAKMDDKAKGILEAFLKATKMDKLKDIKSLEQKATINILKMNMTGNIETKLKGEKIYLFATIANTEEVTAFDGKVAWNENLSTGLRVVEGAEKLNLISTTLPYMFNPEKFYDEIVFEKEVQFAGKMCSQIKFTKKGMDPILNYYDTKTFLQVGESRVMPTPMGKIPVETIYSEYVEHEKGFLYPKSLLQKLMGMEMKAVMTEFKLNTEIDDKIFEKPAQ